MKRLSKNNEGFTLIELVIVIAIIAILIGMIAPNLSTFTETATKSTVQANAKTAYSSATAWAIGQKTEGNTTTAEKVVITNNSGALKAMVGSTDSTTKYESLLAYFNANEIGTASVTIDFTASNTVTSVSWTDGGQTGTYPKSN